MTNSTNFSKTAVNSSNYLVSTATEDVLLLETGDKLLQEDGTSFILLETITRHSTNFSGSATNSTNFS